ncbi:MAG TPA: DUF554 family protein [Verrucomicrobiae bacterium]|nr:DUF554 family protein [Verrucomicrobiae bacterium]
MTGTTLNVLGILVGGMLGLFWIKAMTPRRQAMLKAWLGIFAVIVGLMLLWKSLNGGIGIVLRQFVTIILALTLGRMAGKALRIQRQLNRLGDFAKRRMADAQEKGIRRPNEGFVTCTVLFCFAPLAIVGPILDELGGNWQPLAIKAVMDGLGAMAFVNMFGAGVLLSALPVLAWEGSIAILARWLSFFLFKWQLADSIIGVGALLVFCVALVILEIKKIELGDYLPSLIFAPLLAWLWH